MEFKDGIIKYNMFESLHRFQLESSGVPKRFWFTLYKKIENNIFDAGNVLSVFRIEYDEKKPEDPVYTVLVVNPNGLNHEDPSQIYLIDHAWTYECSKAVDNLRNIPGLVERMCNLMGIPISDDISKNVDNVYREMWKYNQTYSPSFGDVEDRIPLWYIMDELGSAIEHSHEPNFRTVPFFYINGQITYSLLFPIKDVCLNEKVTRDYLEGPFSNNQNLRKALSIPWLPSSFLDVDFEMTEPDKNYFESKNSKEILPIIESPLALDTTRVLKVYSEYSYINQYLRSSDFEIVNTPSEADVLWLLTHIKDYKSYSENEPNKLLNQFPYESLITMKNLLSVICRRKQVQGLDKFSDNPPWYPVSYDLDGEINKFVSYYQNQEKNGNNNLWICKPWNLARGLDITITDNLNCILRLPSTGPKLAQKYLHDPVLFNRGDVGLVKFDIRYVILLQSVKPLKLYAYKNFFLRFANKQYDLTDLWDREKHFTVMNYNDETPLFKMLCDEFIIKFNEQNPCHEWKHVEGDIFKAIKELFEGATSKPPPLGIGHNVQSRALYAIDLMLSYDSKCSDDGKKIIQPKILEVNWQPDCERACRYYPTFYDDVFLLLFKNKLNENVFQKL